MHHARASVTHIRASVGRSYRSKVPSAGGHAAGSIDPVITPAAGPYIASPVFVHLPGLVRSPSGLANRWPPQGSTAEGEAGEGA
jgi:hypothetical protein